MIRVVRRPSFRFRHWQSVKRKQTGIQLLVFFASIQNLHTWHPNVWKLQSYMVLVEPSLLNPDMKAVLSCCTYLLPLPGTFMGAAWCTSGKLSQCTVIPPLRPSKVTAADRQPTTRNCSPPPDPSSCPQMGGWGPRSSIPSRVAEPSSRSVRWRMRPLLQAISSHIWPSSCTMPELIHKCVTLRTT